MMASTFTISPAVVQDTNTWLPSLSPEDCDGWIVVEHNGFNHLILHLSDGFHAFETEEEARLEAERLVKKYGGVLQHAASGFSSAV